MAKYTKISPYRRGEPRYGRRGPEDEPANGPVIEYKLSQEEIAHRYGPPKKIPERIGKHWRRLNRDRLVELLKKRTVGEIAAMYSAPQQLIFKMVERYGIELDEKNRLKEAESVDFTEAVEWAENTEASQATVKNPTGNYKVYPGGDSDKPNDKPKKNRMEQAREKITLEDYRQRKVDGQTDKQIMQELNIHNDVFYRLKKEWGLTNGATVKTDPAGKNQAAGGGEGTKPVPPQVEHGPEPAQEPASGQGAACERKYDVRPDYYSVELNRLNILLEKMDRRLDATVQLLNGLADKYESLEQEYRRHRHQVGPGHWSGKGEV